MPPGRFLFQSDIFCLTGFRRAQASAAVMMAIL